MAQKAPGFGWRAPIDQAGPPDRAAAAAVRRENIKGVRANDIELRSHDGMHGIMR